MLFVEVCIFKTKRFSTFNCCSLRFLRYALNQGAAAFAVDIDDAVPADGSSQSPLSLLKLSQYPVQRRTEASSLSEDLAGRFQASARV